MSEFDDAHAFVDGFFAALATRVPQSASLKSSHVWSSANRMAADTDRQEEQEEAVFTSGAAVGTEGFIRQLVTSEEEVFPTGHKTPPVRFTVGDNKLKALRNLRVLRKKR